SNATPCSRPPARRLMMAPSRISAIWSRLTGPGGNSSPMMVKVAPDALPMPSARWPAWRPMIVTKNHLSVVAASFMRLRTRSPPPSTARGEAEGGNTGRRGKAVANRLGPVSGGQLPAEHACHRRGARRGVVAADGQEVRRAELLQGVGDVPERLGRAG